MGSVDHPTANFPPCGGRLLFHKRVRSESQTGKQTTQPNFLKVRIHPSLEGGMQGLLGSFQCLDLESKAANSSHREIIRNRDGATTHHLGAALTDHTASIFPDSDLSRRSSDSMQIFVRITRKTITLEIDGTERVEDLKEMIFLKGGIPADQQILAHCSKILRDGRILADYHIKKESNIDVSFRLRGGMQVFLRNLNGSTIPIEVEVGDSVDDLKEKIQEKVGIPPSTQYLIYAGMLLRNGKSLADYKVQKQSTLHMLYIPHH